MQMTNLQKHKLARHGYDLGLLARTQPQGNVKIHSGYIESGNGYYTFVNIYHFPKNNLPAFWLAQLANQDKVIAILTVGNQNSDEIKPQLNRALEELQSREYDQKLQATDQMSAGIDQQQLITLYMSMKNNSETLKRIHLRLLVYDSSLDSLMKHVQKIKDNFYAFGMARYIDEQEYDLRSLYLPYSSQQNMPNHRKGKIIESYDLGGSYMFDYVNLTDPGGHYFGYTQTNGAFIFNPFNLKNNNRTRCFQLIGGNAGMGKSTFAKMLNNDSFMRGNYIRNFDVSGEYRKLTESEHGIIIDTSDEGNRVNMFEIFPTVTDAKGNVDAVASFNQNISKIKAITHIMSPGLTHDDLNLLDDILVNFYCDEHLYTHSPHTNPQGIRVLGLYHNQYPTLTEFIDYLEDQQDDLEAVTSKNDQQEIKSIHNLIHAYKIMSSRYSTFFDGHTTLKDDLSKEKVVDFDMSQAKESSTASEGQLFQAIFFSYMSLISAQMIMNGKKYRTLTHEYNDTGGKRGVRDDKLGFNIPYYYINIDEGEDYFNPDYPDVVGMIANMMEEMRKNFCAITFEFPTLKDILLNDQSNVTDARYESYHASVNKIFGLMQYFHLFNLPQSDIKSLKRFFQQNSSVTIEQLDTLQNLDKHELLSVIVGDRSYRWQTELSQNELNRYQ